MGHFKWMYLAGAAAAVCSSAAYADALHGFCSDCVVDNTIGGVQVTSTVTNPLMDFGFWSGGKTGLNGTWIVDILTPDNGGSAPSTSYMISGTGGISGTASLFSATAWTDQKTKLDTYLGISASPTNPLGAWLPATKSLDSSAMGYWVFQANLGTQTLGTSSGSGPLLNLSSSLPSGSVIVAFLEGTKNGKSTITATANSSALFETTTGGGGGGGTGVPEPGTAALFLTALLGFGVSLVRRAPRSRAAAV